MSLISYLIHYLWHIFSRWRARGNELSRAEQGALKATSGDLTAAYIVDCWSLFACVTNCTKVEGFCSSTSLASRPLPLKKVAWRRGYSSTFKFGRARAPLAPLFHLWVIRCEVIFGDQICVNLKQSLATFQKSPCLTRRNVWLKLSIPSFHFSSATDSQCPVVFYLFYSLLFPFVSIYLFRFLVITQCEKIIDW